MKLANILKQPDGEAIPSLDKCELINIGPVKEGQNGDIQFLTVKDNDDLVLKILLKDSSHFLDAAKHKGEGWMISLMAGPPKKGIPQGLTYTVDKTRLTVTKGGVVMKVVHQDEVEAPAANSPSPLPETQSTEKPSNVITNTVFNKSAAQKSGAHDPRIRGYVMERMYLYGIVRDAVIEADCGYPMEKITDLTTSVHIEMSRAGVKVTPPTESKARIDAAYTNGHNPPTPVAPEIKEKPLPAQSTEKPAEPKASKPGTITDYVVGSAAEEWYHVVDGKGNPLGEIAQDDGRRAKMAHWHFSVTFNEVQKDPVLKAVWTAIKSMIDGATRSMQWSMIMEAMRFDRSKVDDRDYAESNFDRFDDSITKIINRADPTAMEKSATNPFALAKIYFDIDPDDRVA